ncbi:MAG TPA: hypothetical protein VL651_08495 [Bacteroidia bacterium]|jgi:hypothetical protein|nr:hypothetical protein [Bacteroidia bacterium]
MKSLFAVILPTLLFHYSFSQASLTALATTYSQDFNSLPNATDGSILATWTNNSTLPGWYVLENSTSATQPMIEASTASMNNTGHAYIVASGADRSLGSRPSGTTGTIFVGCRLKNNTGSTITSLYVDYYGEQWSIAENQANVNTNSFSYQVGTTVTSLTAGAWTNVPALDFTQIYTSSQSAGMGGSACAGSSSQCLALDGNLSSNRTHITACITVTINAGDEIMLRWTDLNDAANDHHLQYDDVQVTPYNVSCATVLPVDLLSFIGKKEGNTIRLDWSTASEENNDHFTIDKMTPSGEMSQLAIVNGNGTTAFESDYLVYDEQPIDGYNYYRLTQTDYNGVSKTYPWIAVNFDAADNSRTAHVWRSSDGISYSVSGWNSEIRMIIYDATGRIISEKEIADDAQSSVTLPATGGGLILVEFTDGTTTITDKIIL